MTQCKEEVREPGRWPRWHRCSLQAVGEHGMCRIHDPETVAAREKRSRERFQKQTKDRMAPYIVSRIEFVLKEYTGPNTRAAGDHRQDSDCVEGMKLEDLQPGDRVSWLYDDGWHGSIIAADVIRVNRKTITVRDDRGNVGRRDPALIDRKWSVVDPRTLHSIAIVSLEFSEHSFRYSLNNGDGRHVNYGSSTAMDAFFVAFQVALHPSQTGAV